MLATSLAPAFHPPPESPYWIPLIGSSGSISPSSIFVRIMRARRPNTSSTPSPLKALTSIVTGTLTLLAQRLASVADTSRPSGAMVALSWVPRPGCVDVEDEYELGWTGVLA